MSAQDQGAANLSDEADWCRRYDEAMQWRDWQTCEILLDERLQADWYIDVLYEEDQERRSRQVVSRVAAYTRTPQ